MKLSARDFTFEAATQDEMTFLVKLWQEEIKPFMRTPAGNVAPSREDELSDLYRSKTGKNFRITKEDSEAGLTREQALEKWFENNPAAAPAEQEATFRQPLQL